VLTCDTSDESDHGGEQVLGAWLNRKLSRRCGVE
jgi:hypothetical protein